MFFLEILEEFDWSFGEEEAKKLRWGVSKMLEESRRLLKKRFLV